LAIKVGVQYSSMIPN